jgi:carboxypeptidase C (cathepsin A)
LIIHIILRGPLGKQYSGYLEINPSTGKRLHYWFIESFHDAEKDPVVLWMNGGPGCSSMDGLFYEMGPMHFFGADSRDLTLTFNPYTWTKKASMIFLEAPAGVGFSYSNQQSDYNTNV